MTVVSLVSFTDEFSNVTFLLINVTRCLSELLVMFIL